VYQRADHINPKKIKLSRDRVLIEDIPDADKIGSIWVPEVAKGLEQIRQGLVVAVGPGDTGIETITESHGTDADGRPLTRIRRAVCGICKGSGTVFPSPTNHVEYARDCPRCKGGGFRHLPISVSVGMKILYQRREESEITIQGRLYDLVYEEQSILLKWETFDMVNYCKFEEPVIVPLRDRILVSRDAAPQKSTGGLFIPASSSEERPEGVVVAVGLGKLRIDGTWAGMEVKPGDHVVFRENWGKEIKIKGERFLVMREDDVYGVLEGVKE
jgi:chaperonin GroES